MCLASSGDWLGPGAARWLSVGMLGLLLATPAPAQTTIKGWGYWHFDSAWNDVRDFVEVSAGHAHTLARRADGSVVAWGQNGFRQCEVPPLPPGLTYVEISAGGMHSLARRSDGTVVAWGDNTFGQLAVPPLTPGVTYVEISAGSDYSVARRSTGTAVAWGNNFSGETNVPVLPPGLTYVEIDAGGTSIYTTAYPSQGFVLARRSDGSVVAWGHNSRGQTIVPPLPSGLTYVEVSAGRAHSVARRSDGSVVAWGENGGGQCNVLPLPPQLTYVEIAAGQHHTIARRSGGSVVGWGTYYLAPPLPPPGTSYVDLDAGFEHAVALRSDGAVIGWQESMYGQNNVPVLPPGASYIEVANGRVARRSDGALVGWGYVPAPALPPGITCVEVAGGGSHAAALLSDGSIVAWGDNASGQCNVPALPVGVAYVQVNACPNVTAALRSDGSIVVWGLTYPYALHVVPALPPGVTYTQVVAGPKNIAAFRTDGRLVVWGYNGSGQLNVPQPSPWTYMAVAPWYGDMVAIRTDGTLVTWGGSRPEQPPPLPPGITYVEVAVGGFAYNALARRSDGSVVGWGQEGLGETSIPTLPAGSSYVRVRPGPVSLIGSERHYVRLGTGCAGSRSAARLVPADTPRIGASLRVGIHDLPLHFAALLTGFTPRPPLDLTAIGMRGCFLYASTEVVLPATGADYRAFVALPVPDDQSLVGLRFQQQAVVPDPGAGNALGLVMSDAATALIGN